jgi:DNA-binding NarL/FixJ family response regulator
MGKHTILIVDDNPEFLAELYDELEESTLFSKIMVAGDGRSALKMAAEYDIEMALVDLLMPGMNGIATTTALHRAQPTLPILIMSNEPGGRTIMEAVHSAGARAFIPKAELLPANLLDYFSL